MLVIVAWVRMDFVAAVLALWLIIFSILPRAGSRILWPFFVIYLAIQLPIIYAMHVGLPQVLCQSYPWFNWLTDASWLYPTDKTRLGFVDNFLRFFNMANYKADPADYSKFMIADFFLLLIAACQERVFRREKPEHPAGDNDSIYKNGKYNFRRDNPHHDFIVHRT